MARRYLHAGSNGRCIRRAWPGATCMRGPTDAASAGHGPALPACGIQRMLHPPGMARRHLHGDPTDAAAAGQGPALPACGVQRTLHPPGMARRYLHAGSNGRCIRRAWPGATCMRGSTDAASAGHGPALPACGIQRMLHPPGLACWLLVAPGHARRPIRTPVQCVAADPLPSGRGRPGRPAQPARRRRPLQRPGGAPAKARHPGCRRWPARHR